MQRRVLSVILALAMLLSCAACGASGTGVRTPRQPRRSPLPQMRKRLTRQGQRIEFIHPATGTDKDAFQTMLMSGELPDMIQAQSDTNYYSGGLQALYEDGAIIDITLYLDEFAPQYKEAINHNDA